MSGDGTFLSRWSKRKREALAQPADDAGAPPEGRLEERPPQQPEGEDQPFDLSSLPDLEALTGVSDVQPFLHKAVPDALRNAALRKVWALDPAVRNYVGEALDYAYDWNTPGGIPGFGEILSDEQSVEFVRNLLAGPEVDEKVIEHAALQQDVSPSPMACQEPDDQKSDASDHSQQLFEKNDFKNELHQAAPEITSTDPPLRRQRHGGALPV